VSATDPAVVERNAPIMQLTRGASRSAVPAARYRVPAALLTVFLLGWLVFRPPFPLAATTAPTGVTATLQYGSGGAQSDEQGVYWWVTVPDALIGVANNGPDAVVAVVSLQVTNGPCSVRRTVTFGDSTARLSPPTTVEMSTGPIALDGYERLSLHLDIDGAPCAPTDPEPRALYVKVTDITVSEADA
jgi:hypothetical protein